MIGIENIGVYIPENREYNLNKSYDGMSVNESFVRDKVGFISTARMGADEETSDMCCKAFDDLKSRAENLSVSAVECICLCTHNGDFQMPHTSAIIQDKLGLDAHCAAFDIGLACSGYVHALNILQGFMELNEFSTGIIFTCDPYSKVLNPNDKNADLLLGDAATATLLSSKGKFKMGRSVFHTKGKGHDAIIKRKDEFLYIDNRRVFNFVLREGAQTLRRCLKANDLTFDAIDLYLLHQASEFVIKQLIDMLKIPLDKAPFKAQEIGNTISSSIPILLQDYLEDERLKTILLCGFGAGMSAAATVLKRV